MTLQFLFHWSNPTKNATDIKNENTNMKQIQNFILF